MARITAQITTWAALAIIEVYAPCAGGEPGAVLVRHDRVPRLTLLCALRVPCGCASLLTLVTSAPRISFFVRFLGPVLIGFGSLDSSARENNYAVSRKRIVARPV